jgi:hypothetical protein
MKRGMDNTSSIKESLRSKRDNKALLRLKGRVNLNSKLISHEIKTILGT